MLYSLVQRWSELSQYPNGDIELEMMRKLEGEQAWE